MKKYPNSLVMERVSHSDTQIIWSSIIKAEARSLNNREYSTINTILNSMKRNCKLHVFLAEL